MATAFERMKEQSRSGETLNELRGANIQLSGREIATRTINALNSTGDVGEQALAAKMKNCGKGNLCSSVYCVRCRQRAAGELRARFDRHISKRFGGDELMASEQLRYVTVLCELTDFNLVDVIAAVEKARKGSSPGSAG